MTDVRQGEGVTLPDGWGRIAFFGRLVNAGICSFTELARPGLSPRHVFDMHRMLDMRELCQRKPEAKAKQYTDAELDDLQRMFDGGN